MLIDEGSGEGTEKLGDPESVPHTDGAEQAAENPRGGNHDDDVAAQRDDEGLGALAQCFQRAGGRDRDGGYQEARADDTQRDLTGGDGIGVGGEHADQSGAAHQADDGTGGHDGGVHTHGKVIDLFHAAMLPGAVIIADEGAHALHNAARGQVQEGLQLIINTQNDHIPLRVSGQQRVEERNQHRGQRQVENGGNADGVKLGIQPPVRLDAAQPQLHGKTVGAVNNKVDA